MARDGLSNAIIRAPSLLEDEPTIQAPNALQKLLGMLPENIAMKIQEQQDMMRQGMQEDPIGYMMGVGGALPMTVGGSKAAGFKAARD